MNNILSTTCALTRPTATHFRRVFVSAHLETCGSFRKSRGCGAAEHHRSNVAVALRDTVTVTSFRVCDLRTNGSLDLYRDLCSESARGFCTAPHVRLHPTLSIPSFVALFQNIIVSTVIGEIDDRSRNVVIVEIRRSPRHVQ